MATLVQIARRLGELLVVLVVLSMIVFALLYLMPGDPARSLIGARPVSPELLASIRAEYHLDDPIWEQYLRWVTGFLHGDLGTSIKTGLPVSQMIQGRAEVTLQLAVLAGLVSAAIGIPAGVIAAHRQGSALDRGINATAVAMLSAPSFALGLLSLYVFAVWLGWFPVYGLGDGGTLDLLWHLFLPVMTLAAGVLASIIKVTRIAMIREVNSDYTGFSRSRGLRESKITRAQIGNAALPIVTSTGLVLATLVSGTVLVEVTFAIGGLGSLLAEAVTFKDVPVVQAVTLLLAVAICTTTAVVDTLVIVLDPRLRRRRRRKSRNVTTLAGAEA